LRGKAGRWVVGGIAFLVALVTSCGGTPESRPEATQLTANPSATPAPTYRAAETPTPPTVPSQSPSPTVGSSAASTPVPTATAVPSPTLPLPDEVVVRETTVSIPSYPYPAHLREGLDAERGVPYLWLDRAAYGQPSAESAVPTRFTAVVLENRYLRLAILPELGGRIYECVFKPTGQNIFYRNQVLKPTSWGPLAREENWWLAAGGMEWAFPVHEHGYEWGVPWSYSIERSANETAVTVQDSAGRRLRMSVEIALAPNRAYFMLRPHLENPTNSAIRYQYWTNAMLTLGSPSMSPRTEFIYPTQEIIVHSAGPDSGVPGERTRISWPVWEGKDLARYENWSDWLGFFVPEPSEDFVGAYNHDTELGVARIFPRQEIPGVKLFAWGRESPYTSEYTDDGSQYFEMWGGPNRTFWPEDDLILPPGESRSWTEYWYAFEDIGGLGFANREAALSLVLVQDVLQLGVATTYPQQGTVAVALGEEQLYREEVWISPESPHLQRLPLPRAGLTGSTVSLAFLGANGEVVAQYEGDLSLP
jgi:hypothetical protein